MIFLLTTLLTVLFAAQYITQFNPTLRRIDTIRRIRQGLLSNADIVRLTHRRYTARHYGLMDFKPIDHIYSCRYHLSSTGRLYKYRLVNGYKSIDFISRYDAIEEIQYLFAPGNHIEEIEYLSNPGSKAPVFCSQFIRPVFCTI